jgi:hypothetical protein
MLCLLLSADFGGGLAHHTTRTKKGVFYLMIPQPAAAVNAQFAAKIQILRGFCGGGGAKNHQNSPIFSARP